MIEFDQWLVFIIYHIKGEKELPKFNKNDKTKIINWVERKQCSITTINSDIFVISPYKFAYERMPNREQLVSAIKNNINISCFGQG